jgi:hypothetical protein
MVDAKLVFPTDLPQKEYEALSKLRRIDMVLKIRTFMNPFGMIHRAGSIQR